MVNTTNTSKYDTSCKDFTNRRNTLFNTYGNRGVPTAGVPVGTVVVHVAASVEYSGNT
ncbi:MAG: hypothetical protein IPL23_22250 [Saprospiraceae bacterium]|nr:hypothetical protein [Saprospiraceae bacterium]